MYGIIMVELYNRLYFIAVIINIVLNTNGTGNGNSNSNDDLYNY